MFLLLEDLGNKENLIFILFPFLSENLNTSPKSHTKNDINSKCRFEWLQNSVCME